MTPTKESRRGNYSNWRYHSQPHRGYHGNSRESWNMRGAGSYNTPRFRRNSGYNVVGKDLNTPDLNNCSNISFDENNFVSSTAFVARTTRYKRTTFNNRGYKSPATRGSLRGSSSQRRNYANKIQRGSKKHTQEKGYSSKSCNNSFSNITFSVDPSASPNLLEEENDRNKDNHVSKYNCKENLVFPGVEFPKKGKRRCEAAVSLPKANTVCSDSQNILTPLSSIAKHGPGKDLELEIYEHEVSSTLSNPEMLSDINEKKGGAKFQGADDVKIDTNSLKDETLDKESLRDLSLVSPSQGLPLSQSIPCGQVSTKLEPGTDNNFSNEQFIKEFLSQIAEPIVATSAEKANKLPGHSTGGDAQHANKTNSSSSSAGDQCKENLATKETRRTLSEQLDSNEKNVCKDDLRTNGIDNVSKEADVHEDSQQNHVSINNESLEKGETRRADRVSVKTEPNNENCVSIYDIHDNVEFYSRSFCSVSQPFPSSCTKNLTFDSVEGNSSAIKLLDGGSSTCSQSSFCGGSMRQSQDKNASIVPNVFSASSLSGPNSMKISMYSPSRSYSESSFHVDFSNETSNHLTPSDHMSNDDDDIAQIPICSTQYSQDHSLNIPEVSPVRIESDAPSKVAQENNGEASHERQVPVSSTQYSQARVVCIPQVSPIQIDTRHDHASKSVASSVGQDEAVGSKTAGPPPPPTLNETSVLSREETLPFSVPDSGSEKVVASCVSRSLNPVSSNDPFNLLKVKIESLFEISNSVLVDKRSELETEKIVRKVMGDRSGSARDNNHETAQVITGTEKGIDSAESVGCKESAESLKKFDALSENVVNELRNLFSRARMNFVENETSTQMKVKFKEFNDGQLVDSRKFIVPLSNCAKFSNHSCVSVTLNEVSAMEQHPKVSNSSKGVTGRVDSVNPEKQTLRKVVNRSLSLEESGGETIPKKTTKKYENVSLDTLSNDNWWEAYLDDTEFIIGAKKKRKNSKAAKETGSRSKDPPEQDMPPLKKKKKSSAKHDSVVNGGGDETVPPNVASSSDLNLKENDSFVAAKKKKRKNKCSNYVNDSVQSLIEVQSESKLCETVYAGEETCVENYSSEDLNVEEVGATVCQKEDELPIVSSYDLDLKENDSLVATKKKKRKNNSSKYINKSAENLIEVQNESKLFETDTLGEEICVENYSSEELNVEKGGATVCQTEGEPSIAAETTPIKSFKKKSKKLKRKNGCEKVSSCSESPIKSTTKLKRRRKERELRNELKQLSAGEKTLIAEVVVPPAQSHHSETGANDGETFTIEQEEDNKINPFVLLENLNQLEAKLSLEKEIAKKVKKNKRKNKMKTKRSIDFSMTNSPNSQETLDENNDVNKSKSQKGSSNRRKSRRILYGDHCKLKVLTPPFNYNKISSKRGKKRQLLTKFDVFDQEPPIIQ